MFEQKQLISSVNMPEKTTFISDIYISQCMVVWLSTHRAYAVFITHFLTLGYSVIQ